MHPIFFPRRGQACVCQSFVPAGLGSAVMERYWYIKHALPVMALQFWATVSESRMHTAKDFTVAICGAGLAGLGLALALHSHGIKCTIFEAVETPERAARGSLQIAPNGQVVLDKYGVWTDLSKSSKFYHNARIMKNDGTLMNEIMLGDKDTFGYESMRVVRRTLVAKLASTIRDRGMDIHCNKKFVRILSETDSGVTIEFADGTTAAASMLVGADGIHSRLRSTLYPSVKTQYIGSIAIGGSVSASEIAGPQDIPYGLYLSEHGSAMIGSHTPDDTDYVAFVGRPHADLGREGWKEMFKTKDRLRRVLQENQDDWPIHVRSAIANLRDDDLWLWPLYVLPELESWSSMAGRVILIGDAAHAMPPTAGQGANMAFEDGYTLGLVLGSLGSRIQLQSALQFWQGMRKARLRLVLEMTMQWAKMREPPNTKNAVSEYKSFESAATPEGQIEQMRWLYGGIEIQEQQIKDWISGHE